MKDEPYMGDQTSNREVYKIPGDDNWEYVVEGGEWKTRKRGSDKLVSISSLSPKKRIEATLRLDNQFKNARTNAEKEIDNEFIGSALMSMNSSDAESILNKLGRGI